MKIIWQKFLDVIEEQIINGMTLEGELEEPISFEKKIYTSMGIIPHDFNFWIGHTDWKITWKDYSTMMWVDGVEILNVCSPYRFVLSIGKAFDDRVVKREIQKVLGIVKKPIGELSDSLDEAKKQINQPYWAIYIAPNGQSKLAQSDNIETVYQKLEEFEATKKLVGGHVEYWRTQV